MLTEVYMPKNGMDMTEGTLIRWLKQVGDPVEAGEPVLEIETDKVPMEAEAPASGTLLQCLYQEGDVVPVLEVMGYIGQPGDTLPERIPNRGKLQPEPIPALQAAAESGPEAAGPAATPYAKALARTRRIDLRTVVSAGETGIIHGADVERTSASHPRATPLARRVAESLGADLREIQGSGCGGKIVKADVLAAYEAASAPAAPQEEAAPQSRVPMSPMRRVISKRMLASHTEIPPVTTAVKVDMTELLLLRERINRQRDAAERISVNDLIIKAVSQSLARNQRFCMTLQGNSYVLTERTDIGVAVAVEDGLLVPVVRNAGNRTVSELSQEVKRLAKQARTGSLRPEDTGGGCITISNLGMYGTYAFTPIINQPEASIIGVCAIEDELALLEGQVTVRKKMILCMTYDHRIINGAEASQFQSDLKARLENPLDILL